MKPIAPNTLIQNRYLIVHLIGKGGMGEVYLAVDQRLGSAIALKRTFFSDDVLLGNAFEREARTLARLRHPVLPKVSDHFTDEGTQYLVMEHISGEDMSKRLEAMQKPFPLSWVLFWADQLLDSLNYLHTHEPPIIHRDIKPQNLKLTDENHIVLLDFGLSKNSSGETRAATTGSIVGYTPHYAPMEQIRGTGTDARSDLYSLSATLYQILTANVPPDALTRADSLINGLPDPIQPISEINTEVSKGISDVIIKGMAISQDQRYKTAREMQKALRDAYAQMQNEMSANTVEYSSGSQPEILQSQQKTEVLSSVPLNSQPSLSKSNASDIAAPTEILDLPPAVDDDAGKTVADFDATLRYDEEVHSSTSKQADIKTEVFLAGSSSAITSAQDSYAERKDFLTPLEPEANDDFGRDVFGKTENFANGEEDFSQSVNYSPNATVPLISFGNQTRENGKEETAASFDSLSNRENNAATFVPTATSAADERVYTPSTTPAKQKSSRTMPIIGGLAALLILAASAVAVGWFLFKDGGTSTGELTPLPTSEATVSSEPTTEPTVMTGSEININTDMGGLTNTDTGNSNATNGEISPTGTKTPAETRPTNTPLVAPPTPRLNVPPTPNAPTPRLNVPTPRTPTPRPATPTPKKGPTPVQ